MKRLLKLLKLSLLRDILLNPRDFQIAAEIALMVVEHPREDFGQHGFVFGAARGRLGIDIEEDRLCRRLDAVFEHRVGPRVAEFVLEIFHGVFARDKAV